MKKQQKKAPLHAPVAIPDMQKPERGSLAQSILRLVESEFDTEHAEANALKVINYFKPQDRFERNRIWKAIKYLEEQNRIAIKERGDEYYILLTQEGKVKLAEVAIWDLSIAAPKRWDKKWRIVMFDFPKEMTTTRNSFRQKIEDIGFKVYQRSVYIYPFECTEEVKSICEFFNAEAFVRYVVAIDIDNTEEYIKLFELE
jgi:DNA-binding transcriptional regulator PaaX